MKTSVLFLCIHNSARSQIAEAFLKVFGGENLLAESAGIEPGTLNPLVIEVMKEDGIDISGNRVKDVFEFHRQGRQFDYVITVCEPAAAGQCPAFPGVMKKISWEFPDPSKFIGSYEVKLQQTRNVRDQIKQSVLNFIKQNNL